MWSTTALWLVAYANQVEEGYDKNIEWHDKAKHLPKCCNIEYIGRCALWGGNDWGSGGHTRDHDLKRCSTPSTIGAFSLASIQYGHCWRMNIHRPCIPLEKCLVCPSWRLETQQICWGMTNSSRSYYVVFYGRKNSAHPHVQSCWIYCFGDH